LSQSGCGAEFRQSEAEYRQFESDAAGFVLAGGKSARMGRDKALVQFAGKPLVAHALSILQRAGLPAAIAGAQSDLAAFAPVVNDTEPGRGPLAGVCVALASTAARYAVFLSIDLPFLPPSLLIYLLHHARITRSAVVVPSVAGFGQTFPAVLDRAVLPALQAALERGNGGCFAAFQAAAGSLSQEVSSVGVEVLAQSGQVTHLQGLPAAHWFLNVNSADDLERAKMLRMQDIA
jgi:molybdopterin-guanine dinucleotide biosynthesis protein A